MTHSAAPAFAFSNGPREAKVVLVGEAWGENEDLLKTPFVGWSGYELSKMLCEAGLIEDLPLGPKAYSNMMLQDWWKRQGLLLTNVFAFRPLANKIDSLCGKRADVGASYWRQPMGKGGYIREEYFSELERLREELLAFPRNCIIALGATASWALLNQPKITSIRGVTANSSLCPGLKVLPTYHPAGIMRNWTWRAIAVADLRKVALREGLFPEIKRSERQVLINPSLQDVRDFFSPLAPRYAVDVETMRGQITMVGFASSTSRGLCIPLVDRRARDWSYWSPSDEREVYEIIRGVMEGPSEKFGQNFLYDTQYFIRALGMRPRNCVDDTMLLSHSLMPEMQKSLGFLGSIYTNEASWKLFRHTTQDELKRDE